MEYLDTSLFVQIPQYLRVIFCGILGLIIGSFLNVVIYRLPIMIHNQQLDEVPKEPFNLFLPHSHCPNCKSHVPLWANIPIIGYLLIRGKCVKCFTPIGIRYLMVEILTGGLFAVASYPILNIYLLLAILIFISFCICAIFIDYDTYLLPDEITLPLLWFGLIANYHGLISGSLEHAVLGAIIGYLSLWSIFWIFKIITKKEGMGYGDFKFLAAILAFLGVKAIIPITLIASFSGILYAIGVRVFCQNSKHSVEVPFGPFLGLAAIIFIIISQYYYIQY